jgi:outer membrane receptor protein involved in Fe transport
MITPASLQRLVCLLGLLLCVHALGAAETTVKAFAVPAGDAAVTLKVYVEQSGEQIAYLVDTVRGVRTNPVNGTFAPREALKHMLDGTPLIVRQDKRSDAVTINRKRTPATKKTSPRQPTASAPPINDDDQIVELSPFQVRADRDTGYAALQSNSFTAFRIDLKKMPATAQIFTSTFINDVGATSIQDVLINYTGVVTADPNNTGAAINNMPGDRDGSGGGLGIRGLAAGAPKRDGLAGPRSTSRTPTGYNDTFSVERIELIEGPQSLLYGAVGGGGVVNVVSKLPVFDQQWTSASLRFDQYGSRRAVLDTNYGTDRIAIRVAALGSKSETVRENIGSDGHGLYTIVAFRLGARASVRFFHELTAFRGNVAYNPASADLNNFFYEKDASGRIVKDAAGIPVVNLADPRRGKDSRYLALTGQLADLQGVLWDGPVDYNHISSFGSWWSSEYIRNNYTGATLETKLPWGFAAQLTAIHSETIDERATVSKNLVPAAGYTGSGANPLAETAVRFSPGLNYQTDRTRGVRFNLLHGLDFELGRLKGTSQTAFGFEWGHQGPAFGSGGIDMLYYQADANWNVVTSPGITLDYGRVPLSALYFGVKGSVPDQPFFRPATGRVTVAGVNYVLQPRIKQDASLISAANPGGLVPNNPTASNPNGYAGNWNRGGDTHSRLFSLANYTEWWDGRVATLIGASVNRFDTVNFVPGTIVRLLPRDYWGTQYGISYEVRPWLRAYANLSTAGQSAGSTSDFYGRPLSVPKVVSPAPEVGLKFSTSDDRYSAQFAYNFTTKVENEARNAGIDFFNAVNPNGINGRHNSGDQWINVDRTSNSAELTLTASPTREWRFRLAAVKLDGEISRTVSYAQLYNDQFRTSGGVVIYPDGLPVFVNSVTGEPVASGGTPLTLAMINDPASALYAAPNVDSGSISGVALRTALSANPIALMHGGASATGATGLPLSAMQYNWANAGNGVVTVVGKGEKNTGIDEYTLNFQSNYVFSTGRLKGFGIFTAVRTNYNNRAFYTRVFPTSTSGTALQAQRVLYRLPRTTVVDFNVSYSRPLWGKYVWSTQLNINNVFDSAEVNVLPSPANSAVLNARLTNQPRRFFWTNTLSF